MTFSRTLCRLSSSRSLALESWEDLEDRPLFEGPGPSEALVAAPLLFWLLVDVEAMICCRALGH